MEEIYLLSDLGLLLQKIKCADKAYETSTPIMDDSEYDATVDKAFTRLVHLKYLGACEDNYPLIKQAEEYLNKMRDSNNNNRKRSFEKQNHLSRVEGLDKVYTIEEFKEYMDDDIKSFGDGVSYYYIEPKYDGINVSLIYQNGELQKILTRGDGLTGEDITPLVKGLESIPLTVFWKEDVQVNGELIVSNGSFQRINSNTKRKYKTPRSALMGFINSRDRFRIRTYAVFLPHSKTINGRYEKKILDLKRNKFHDQVIFTYSQLMTDNKVREIQNGTKKPEDIVNTKEYPLDGIVITHAETMKSVAIKHKFISYTTTIVKGVKWNISGKLAKLTCSLIVDPVVINKKEYTNMPLKDLSLIENNEVMINQKVIVSLEDNTLKYENSVKDNTVVNLQRIMRPVLCPRCLEPLTNKNYDYYCKHEKCIGAITACYNKFNRALDLNVSTAFIQALIDDEADNLYKYVSKLLESSNLFKVAIQEAPMNRIISAFNIETYTPRDYERLAEILELTGETCDVNALRTKVHKLGLKNKDILHFKRKMSMYYTYCDFSSLWIQDFFRLIGSIKKA